MNDFSAKLREPDFDLGQSTLVEASAGTGKTYNIQDAYLRLILGHELPVDKILVVTFTEAAAHELRERLRRILADARDVLQAEGGQGDHGDAQAERKQRIAPLIAAAGIDLQDEDAKREALVRIKLAMMDFDKAPIFTIHGFCQRVLERYAFECGHDPLAELVTDEAEIIAEVCKDWWRKHAYGPASDEPPFKDLDELVQIASAAANSMAEKFLPEAELDEDCFQPIKKACDELWELIGNLKSAGEWAGGLKIRNKNTDTDLLDIAPLAHVIEGKIRTRSNEDKAELTKALEYISAACANPPSAQSDAKAFKQAIKTVHEDGDGFVSILKQKDLLAELKSDIRQRIKLESYLTFDDMLRNVKEALEGPNGGQLKEVLRGEFQAAMIDEFQDTDPIQYSIFKTLFMDGSCPLVFVGDPKQAIYGFRGGDVFTYYRAKQKVGDDRRFGLGTNYRSEQALIAAINELFKDSNHADNTFRHDSIPYPGDLQARGVAGDKLLRQDGDKPQSLRIWRYEYDDSKKPGQNKPIVDILFADVADEIVRLIMDESCRIGERSVAAKDIAVLVHTHKEAERIHAKLLERKVNAVLQNTGNVFASIEARDLALILAAMLDPSDADALRGALAGSLLPCSQQELIAFCREDDAGGAQATPATPDSVDTGRPSTLVDWMDLFKEAGARWRERALSDALAFLIRRTGMRAYLVGLPGGERRLTNLLHLLDIINATASQLRQGPSGLLSWFKRQLENDSRDGEDEHLMRLASDEDAVKIMTVFKSKGLEFPIVFVPTLWRKKAEAKGRNERTISYHDDEDMLVVTLDTKDPHAQRRAKEESLQEDVRLLYVAATRAINRVYITQLHPFLPDDYGLDWVLGGLDPGAGGHILIEDRSGERASALQLAKGAGLAGDALQTAGAAKVDKRHGHSSFSSIEPNMREMAASSARDIDSTPGSEAQTENDYARQTDIFSIPGGARTGECWHAIFEDIDFSAAESDIRAVVAEKLDRYNICSSASADIARARRESVHNMVRNTLATALPAPDGGFALKQIRMDARRSELEFNFTLRQSGINPRTTGISEVLKTHWKRDEDKQPFLAALENWDRELPLGFMTGFIDLVFCHAERFYIVDWKSNRRSGRLADFGAPGIRDEMARHSYFLQYLIYTLALHGYLQRHLAHYEYETHFGGVFYLFLRGIENEETHGIFAQRPKWELIDDLAQVLTGSGAEA